MPTDRPNAKLLEIPVDRISRNPENPRIVFRSGQLEELTESIRRYGVQVPIVVFREKSRYVLIDGERRWRCSVKLNRKTIPALIQDKPDPLTNLLLMFNIHALREQWDLLTIALKLPRVVELLTARNGRSPNERELSEHTGLSRGLVRRCRLLMGLPQAYKDLILQELHKPKPQQRLTEDFFIEMERSLRTVERAMPEAVPDKDRVRKVLIEKFKRGVIVNRVDFRKLAKIARAERVEVEPVSARAALTRLFDPRNGYSIEDAFNESVSSAYTERDLLTRIRSLVDRLKELNPVDLDEDMRTSLARLAQLVSRLLEI